MDFLPTCNSENIDVLHRIYGLTSYHKDIFFALNLQWPTFDLPKNKTGHFLSWHTEQFDTYWLIEQATNIYPTPIFVAYDGVVDTTPECWPDNISYVQWITLADQLTTAIKFFGLNENYHIPTYKLSSLSFRYSQYKKFITAYLLKNLNSDDLILSWHNQVGKPEDLHSHPAGFAWLDALNYEQLLDKIQLNFHDEFSWDKNIAVSNVNWKVPAYTDALINLTNESFHYSNTIINNISATYPGPYITEKTFKPLLAGRPFVAVGQCNTLDFLTNLGFDLNFGWDNSYDTDCGDLTRIKKIFDVLEQINTTQTEELFYMSLPAVNHNTLLIKSNELSNNCKQINKESLRKIKDFLGA